MCGAVLSRGQLFATPWTEDYQAPLSMGSSRQEYLPGVGCHFLLQGIFPTHGIASLSPALADGFFTICATWELCA